MALKMLYKNYWRNKTQNTEIILIILWNTNYNEIDWYLDDARSLMAYLYGPVAVIIFSNIVFFVLTAIQLYRVSVDAALATNNSHAKQK